MRFPRCFQQSLLILSKISKTENPRWRPSAANLDFLFVTMTTVANWVMIVTMQIN